jgi:hypothetical protein
MKNKNVFPLEVPGERHSGVPLRKPLTAKDLEVEFNETAWKQSIAARERATGQKEK